MRWFAYIYNKKSRESSITTLINPNKAIFSKPVMKDMKMDDFDLISGQTKINIEELISS